MIKKVVKPKKAILKRGVDAFKLVDELERLKEEGKVMLEQSVISEDNYDIWYNQVLGILVGKFTSAENEYKSRFVGPASYLLVSHDGKPDFEQDLQFELRSYLGEELVSLDYIISEIQRRLLMD